MPSSPSCFSLLPTTLFSNWQTQIGAINTGAELQAVVNRIFAELSLLESTLTSQMNYLQPLEALLAPPGENLGSIVSWITSLIAFLQQMYQPYLTAEAMMVAIPIEIATLTADIEAAASRLGVSVTIPSITTCTL